MKRNAILGAAFLVLAGCAQAQTEDGKCGSETMKGTYGFQFTGVRPARFVPPGKPGFVGQSEQVNGIVIRVFDGKGSFTQSESSRGTITGYIPSRPGTGTYVVSADCSVDITIQVAPGITAMVRGVIVDGGKEIRGFTVGPEDAYIQFVARQIK